MDKLFDKKDSGGKFIRFGKYGEKFYYTEPHERGAAMKSASAERAEKRAKDRKNASKKTE